MRIEKKHAIVLVVTLAGRGAEGISELCSVTVEDWRFTLTRWGPYDR